MPFSKQGEGQPLHITIPTSYTDDMPMEQPTGYWWGRIVAVAGTVAVFMGMAIMVYGSPAPTASYMAQPLVSRGVGVSARARDQPSVSGLRESIMVATPSRPMQDHPQSRDVRKSLAAVSTAASHMTGATFDDEDPPTYDTPSLMARVPFVGLLFMGLLASAAMAQKLFGRSQSTASPVAMMTVTSKEESPPSSPHIIVPPTPIIIDGEQCHTATREQLEVMNLIVNDIGDDFMNYLKPIDKSWQPADLLPDASQEGFFEEVKELQQRSLELPDDYLVVLAGDMITEEALPTYISMLNTIDGMRDETGSSSTPWAQWIRKWTAEENRHGDLLNKYMYLTGRVDMKAIEVTIQRLIGSGMNPKTENHPYFAFLYTSFQERATRVSHGNTARMAKEKGDSNLATICGLIAADEARHEAAYTRVMKEIFDRDPDGAMVCYASMMRKQVTMPAHYMSDGSHKDRTGRLLFDDFSAVAQRLGVYTAEDYVSIMEHLNKKWDIEHRVCLTPEGKAAQEFLMKFPARIRNLAIRMANKKKKSSNMPLSERFSWIYGREIML